MPLNPSINPSISRRRNAPQSLNQPPRQCPSIPQSAAAAMPLNPSISRRGNAPQSIPQSAAAAMPLNPSISRRGNAPQSLNPSISRRGNAPQSLNPSIPQSLNAPQSLNQPPPPLYLVTANPSISRRRHTRLPGPRGECPSIPQSLNQPPRQCPSIPQSIPQSAAAAALPGNVGTLCASCQSVPGLNQPPPPLYLVTANPSISRRGNAPQSLNPSMPLNPSISRRRRFTW